MAEKDKPAKAAKPQGGAQGGDKAQKAKSGGKKAEAAAAPRAAASPRPKDYKPRLKAHYEKVVRDALTTWFGAP